MILISLKTVKLFFKFNLWYKKSCNSQAYNTLNNYSINYFTKTDKSFREPIRFGSSNSGYLFELIRDKNLGLELGSVVILGSENSQLSFDVLYKLFRNIVTLHVFYLRLNNMLDVSKKITKIERVKDRSSNYRNLISLFSLSLSFHCR